MPPEFKIIPIKHKRLKELDKTVRVIEGITITDDSMMQAVRGY